MAKSANGSIAPPPTTDPNPPLDIDGKKFALCQIAQLRKDLNALEKCLKKLPDWKGKKRK